MMLMLAYKQRVRHDRGHLSLQLLLLFLAALGGLIIRDLKVDDEAAALMC